jgi:hypothetical protein
MYDLVNTSHEIFDLAEARRGSHEISDATGFNSGYWFLGTTLSINKLLHAHYLPTDRAGSLVDMVDRRAILTPSVAVVWADDGLVTKDGAVLHP